VVLGSYQISGYAANTWVTLKLRANGNSLSVDVDRTTRITATDSSFTSGQAGVWSYAPGSARAHSFDDFTIVQLGAGMGSKVLAKPYVAKPAQRQAAQGGGPITTRSYMFFNGARVAMRQCAGTCWGSNLGVVTWLHSDMLGSATLATKADGRPVPGSDPSTSLRSATRRSVLCVLVAAGCRMTAGLPLRRRGFNSNRADISGLLDFSSH
jgi:hypothetical protein